MNKTALIIGSSFFHYNISISNAFKTLGYQTFIEEYDLPVHPFKGWLKWRHKFSLNRKKLREKSYNKYNNYIIEKFNVINPNIVFIFNGNILQTRTLDHFRKTAKVILWMFDSLSRYPKSIDHIDHVDAFFCYEKQDVEWYAQQGKTAFFMPQGYDEKCYFPQKVTKDIDILFVGILYNYKKRIKLLTSVVKNFTDTKILIFGVYKPYYKGILKWLFREKRKIYQNKNIPPQQVNDYYNRAKVVLNIHHETQKDGANPKVFEISGAGAYQICDYNPYITSLFPNGEVGLYKNEQELFDLIEDALQNNKSENAKKAQEIVLENHTFLHRVKEMLAILDKHSL